MLILEIYLVSFLIMITTLLHGPGQLIVRSRNIGVALDDLDSPQASLNVGLPHRRLVKGFRARSGMPCTLRLI